MAGRRPAGIKPKSPLGRPEIVVEIRSNVIAIRKGGRGLACDILWNGEGGRKYGESEYGTVQSGVVFVGVSVIHTMSGYPHDPMAGVVGLSL